MLKGLACVCVYTCRERYSVCVCLRLIVGYAVLKRLASVCVYIHEEREIVCVCACASLSGTRCSNVLLVCVNIYAECVCVCVHVYIYIYNEYVCEGYAVPRLVLPRLAYHVEHEDKRIRRGVGVRAGVSQGRRELQAAADNELFTETCATRRP